MEAIYARVSTEDQARHGYSLAGQLTACRERLRAMGAGEAREYVDDGYSGEFIERPALERLRADGRCPQIVLADYQLQQGRTGPEAVVAVQAMMGRTVPGIILTGDTSSERQEEAERRGFRLLHKPVFPNDLRRMMASAGAA